ncbi:TPA: glycosyltransferase family 4 protein [Vibrio parahaemolyticus]|uniref:Glycogen synthase n=1 Tax=Vibrio parahaemolyticus TaxID=670 RepID=A0A7M1WQE1_VIBPH|nr:glycosyltransferase family 4 protein [Vibrio parahaemolyticus]AGB08758.1 glycosyltransferase, GT1 family [Vibrio parahaemolyticus BB22OP]EGR2564753.1 glycosyltransferase family 4 protein [Vibrio parahaemolyticus]EJG1271857.1 glycosyltransferase family 4 protein [Vibrio parahaemolyticus]EJG1276030.1 glycosyltransferase family 4 protein [Vibrio parahaemolyticus]EJG1285717.1 glycosyltransferase family 4 protein [Vibrio parahaemolyticus]
MRIAIIVPGWSSKFRPYFMPFFAEQISNLSKRSGCTFDIYIANSISKYFKLSFLRFFFNNGFDQYDRIESKNVNLINVNYVNLPFSNLSKRISQDRYINANLNLIEAREHSFGEYDLIHCHFFTSARVGFEYFNRKGRKYVITEHASDLTKSLDFYTDDYIRSVYNKASTVVAVSNRLKKELHRVVGIELEKISVIPNGVDTEKFSIVNGAKCRTGEIKKVLFIGHLIERKGVFELVKVVHNLIANNINVYLTIIGVGELSGEILNYLKVHNLSEFIEIKGGIPNHELPSEIHKHDLLVLPSQKESFGVVVVEAGACGLPAIVSRCGGPEDIIEEEFLGSTYSLDDINGLHDSLIEVLSKFESYSSTMIREHTVNKYSWDVVAEKILSLYEVKTS